MVSLRSRRHRFRPAAGSTAQSNPAVSPSKLTKKVATSDVSVPDLLAVAVAALGGSERGGQLEMAAAVAQAFATEEHLVAQAGTGTGKSLAYLIPAIVRAL